MNDINELIDNEERALIEPAMDGCPYGMMKLGEAYLFGKGIEKDSDRAFNWLLKSAKADNPEAMMYVGDIYGAGKIMPQCKTRCFNWYLEAAKANNVVAMAYVGDMYKDGEGCEVDEEKSQYWYGKVGEYKENKAKKEKEYAIEQEKLKGPLYYEILAIPHYYDENKWIAKIKMNGELRVDKMDGWSTSGDGWKFCQKTKEEAVAIARKHIELVHEELLYRSSYKNSYTIKITEHKH